VTGIINTFKLITVFGSGDVKTLSGGISEALITTEFGLIVAIPSLLLHSFLSRKARGIVGRLEAAAVALVNQVAKTPFVEAGARVERAELEQQVREILRDLLASKQAYELPRAVSGEAAVKPSRREVAAAPKERA
jgi:hypothetical protein